MNAHTPSFGRPETGRTRALWGERDESGAAIREHWWVRAPAALHNESASRCASAPLRGLVAAPECSAGSGGGADGTRELPPRAQPWERGGEVQDNTARRSVN